jgi:conjugative transfer pilus assembly protein TraH
MIPKKWFIGISILLQMVVTSVNADTVPGAAVSNDIDNYYKSLGFSSNITSPQAYQGQQAGYYTGGSIFARTPVRNVQLVQIELPSYRAGCGGIDIYSGGFSYVKYDDLVTLMQNVMSNSAGYAFTLAMETATPELTNVMKYINDKASEINRANINSCETAEALVGGVWPRTRATQQQICRDIGGSKGGLFDDWAQARQKCGVGSEFSTTMDKARTDPHYKNMVFDSGNVVWKIIKQNNLLNNDDELAQFFMSLSGTVIISKVNNRDDAPVNYNPLPGLMDKEQNNLIHALLVGGVVNIYKCDQLEENACLHPKKSTITIDAGKGFGTRIKALLDDMVNNVIVDKPLTPEEIGLLQATSLPVYKMLNVQVAYSKDKDTLDIAGYADIIATDIIFQYLQESLRIIRQNVAASQYPEALLKKLQPNIDKELTELREEHKNAYSRMSMSIQLIEKTQMIEKMLAGNLSTQIGNSLSWARGLT